MAREVSARRALDVRGTRGQSLVKVKVIVEGGGDGKALKVKCRQGFRSFFEKASLAGRMPRITAGGSRATAFDMFRTAWVSRKAEDFIVLLVDSEDPVAVGSGPWQHLAWRDGWDRPGEVTDEHAHLMVQCMEVWFLADKESLAAYFGHDFNRNALPGAQEIEEVAKADVLEGLKNATRGCKKGQYGKGRHSFDILEQTDPTKVFNASPHARRLLETLRDKAT